MNEQEQERLAKAWQSIRAGLKVYQELTGADNLVNATYESLWEIIGFQYTEAMHETPVLESWSPHD